MSNADAIAQHGGGTSWWLFDEPFRWADWNALAYYAGILKEVKDETGAGDNFKFRVDVSRLYNAHDFMENIIGVSVVSQDYASKNLNDVKYRSLTKGEVYRTYGSWNRAQYHNSDNMKMVLRPYVEGGTGFLSWENYGDLSDFESINGNELAVLYPGSFFFTEQEKSDINSTEYNIAMPSARLKAVRKVTELTRYLDALKALGYSDKAVNDYVKNFVNVRNSSVENNYEAMKRDILKKLTGAKTEITDITKSGGQLIVSYTAAKSARLITAYYDDGTLVKSAATPITASVGDVQSFDIPAGADEVKVMIWHTDLIGALCKLKVLSLVTA